MKETLAVGVIGCGSLAQAVHLPHLAELPGVRLRWACDASPEVLNDVRLRFAPERITQDYREVIEDPETDAIVLATTQTVRLPVIQLAAERGVPVYCEKPVADSLDELERINRIVTDAGLTFCVGHNRRSAPAMRRLWELYRTQRATPFPCPWRFDRNSNVRERWPEEDQTVMAVRVNDDLLSWKAWAVADEIMATGPMLFEMTHFTDLACWFIGCAPVAVTAAGHRRTNHTVTIEFENGSLVSILETGVGTFGYPKELYEIFVHGAALAMDHFVEVRTGGMEGVARRSVFPLKADRAPDIAEGGGIGDYYAKRRWAELRTMDAGAPERFFEFEPVVDKGHKQHLAGFLDAVRGNGSSPCTCADTVVATRLAFAALESLREGRTIRMG